MHPVPLRLFKSITLFCLGLCLSLCLAQALSAQTNQGITQATVKEIIDGTQVFIQNQQAKVNDVAQLRQRVRTGDARAELTFNNGVVARLAKNSILTVGQCTRLQRGTLLVNGAVNGCTSSIVAAVRGTTYVLQVDESGKQEVKVLEGEVVVRRETTPDPAEPTVETPQVLQSPTPVPSPTTNVRPATPKVQPSKVNRSARQHLASLPPTNGKPAETTIEVTKLNSSRSARQHTASPLTTKGNLKTQTALLAQTDLPTPTTDTRPPTPLDARPTETKPILSTSPTPTPTPQAQSEVVLKAGESLDVDANGVLSAIQKISQAEFESLLKGALFQGFSSQLPSIGNIRSVFEGLFPGASFPISIPSVPSVPSVPGVPRLPF